MIRLSKLTDYGFVLLTRFAAGDNGSVHNAPDLAAATGLPLPTVSKLLKLLARGGLLSARRGSKGGYELARSAAKINATDILAVLEGPMGLTDCVSHPAGVCDIEQSCQVRGHWRRINDAVIEALEKVTLAEMAAPVSRRRAKVQAAARSATPVRQDSASRAPRPTATNCGSSECVHESGESCACAAGPQSTFSQFLKPALITKGGTSE